MSISKVQDHVDEIVKAKKAAEEKARLETEARQAAHTAHQNAVNAAKAAARARWPEVKSELAHIVETYNAQKEALGVHLTLEELPNPRAQLQPQNLTIHGNHRTLAALFTIGETNQVGYSLKETTLGGHRSAIPEKLPKNGGVTDIGELVKQLVTGVVERSFR
jgi:hypothetical protein